MGPILLDFLIFLKRETRYIFLIQFVFPLSFKMDIQYSSFVKSYILLNNFSII